MNLEDAKPIAEKYLDLLNPFCQRIEIAGSIRRKCPQVKDIEIVCIPRDIEGFSKCVRKWQKVKGEPTGKYTQRILPEGIKLDLFIVNERNWGNIFAIRTGPAEFSHKVLACGWVRAGYKSENGMLKKDGQEIECREEEDLFHLIGIAYIKPEQR